MKPLFPFWHNNFTLTLFAGNFVLCSLLQTKCKGNAIKTHYIKADSIYWRKLYFMFLAFYVDLYNKPYYEAT